MKSVKSVVSAVLCLLLALIPLASCEKKAESVKVTVSEVTHSVFYAPQYAAINKGFFADEGIEIELTNGQGADKVMTAVISGSVDIGFCGPEAAIYVYNEGKDDYAEVFAQLTKKDGSFIVGREKAESFDFASMTDKVILPGRKGGVPYMTLEYVLKQHGLYNGKNITFDDSVQFAMMTGAFTGGTGDYVTMFEPTASMIEKEGKGYIVASVGAESGEIPYTAYMASKSFIEKNPELIQKFVNALYRGQLWVEKATAEEIADVIAPSFPDTDKELLTASVNSYKAIDAWNQTPVMNREAFERLQMVITEAGELKQKAPFDKVVNNAFAQKATETVK